MPMIETINLTKRYGDLVALDSLNLTIEEGGLQLLDEEPHGAGLEEGAIPHPVARGADLGDPEDDVRMERPEAVDHPFRLPQGQVAAARADADDVLGQYELLLS